MRFDVLTLFPEIFQGYLGQSLLKLALRKGLVEINLWNLRDWATDKHRSVDDRPFGGGPGMVIMPGPVFDAVEAVRQQGPEPGELVLLTPAGERLTQALVRELAGNRRLLLLCGRYEGFDERVRLKPDRIKYWMSVGAQPSEKLQVLFKKYMEKFEKQAAEAAAPAAAPAPEPAPEQPIRRA